MDDMEFSVAQMQIVSAIGQAEKNLSYILNELPDLKADSQLKSRVKDVCERFRTNIRRACKNFTASAMAYRHLPGAANARVAGENAGVLLASFQGALLESHDLVGDLRVADQSLLSLLVVESMTNVLNVHASLQEQVENWQRMCAARASGGDGDLESGQRRAGPVRFNCDVCGEATLTVSIVIGQDGKGTLRKNSATYYSLDDKSAQAWLQALTDNPRSVLAGLTGEDMFCQECQKFYCREHWTNVRDYFDDGFYDYTAGNCPAGHRCIIDD